MPWNKHAIARLLTVVVFAGVVAGLLSNSHSDLATGMSRAQAGTATLASVKEMHLLRDEHDPIVDMVKSQLAPARDGSHSKR